MSVFSTVTLIAANTRHRNLVVNLLLAAMSLLIATSVLAENDDSLAVTEKPIVPVGIFLGKIEEGARIFAPIRLLPFDHPESEGHQFPNALQLHQSEFDLLVWMGKQVGLKLRATLERYPKPPTANWWYKQFREIPVEEIEQSEIRHIDESAPVPGLRIVAFVNDTPVGFIIDTRSLSLEDRGMERATAMGLDMTRQQFLDGLGAAHKMIPDSSSVVVIFDR